MKYGMRMTSNYHFLEGAVPQWQVKKLFKRILINGSRINVFYRSIKEHDGSKMYNLINEYGP